MFADQATTDIFNGVGSRRARRACPATLWPIARRKRAVTPDTALRLARVTGMGADFWLGLQQDWDLWHALRTAGAVLDNLEPLPHVR